jgi:hypothetical protein
MTPKLSLLAILSAGIPGCSSFCHPSPHRSSHIAFRSSRSHVLFNNEVVREGIISETTPADDDGNNDGRIEFWLDLRGTSITPKTALELWDAEAQDANKKDANPSFSPPFSKFLVSFNDKQPTDSTQGNVMMVEEDGESFNSISTKQPFSFGSIVHLEASQSTSMPILPDPLPLIDKYSSGESTMLDTNAWRKAHEDEKLGLLFPLVELITSMPQHLNNNQRILGWTCCSESEIIKSAMWIQCRGGRGGSEGRTKTLESGIVIVDEDGVNESGLGNGCSTRFVILIPYDVGLLKTAASLLQDGDDDRDN